MAPAANRTHCVPPLPIPMPSPVTESVLLFRSFGRPLFFSWLALLPFTDFAFAVQATGSLKETSGLLGLSAKRSLYSAGRSISGTKARGQRSSLLMMAWPSVSTVRCEATVAEKEAAPVEKFEYQAKVTRLLDPIVHSLYSHKEVFLRELVSVTEPNLLEANTDLEICIQTDAKNGTITIFDTGVGMTRDELVRSLGTIAESGTAKFLKALKDNKENPILTTI
ncbi:unnamed protein product [Calypogeia fissa]